MRILTLFCLLALVGGGLGGCAFMSDEDRDFYGKGWVNPKELDRPMEHHAIPNPEGDQPGSGPSRRQPNSRDSDDGGAWTAPPLQMGGS